MGAQLNVITWYVKRGGSDNNSGSRVSTSAYASGTGASLNSTSTISLLTDAPDLSGVVDNLDTIRLSGQTTGIYSSDIWKITSHNNTAGVKTVTVSTTSISGTPGTVNDVTWAIGGCFATPDRALNLVNADGSEDIYFCGGVSSGVDSIPLNAIGIDTARAATNSNALIRVIGADSSGNSYDGSGYCMLEDSTGSSGAYGVLGNHNYYEVRDLYLYNFGVDAIADQLFIANNGWVVRHCKVSNSVGGFRAGGQATFIDCTTVEVSANSGYAAGFYGRSTYIRCSALFTSVTGVAGFHLVSNGGNLIECWAHGSSLYGFRYQNTSNAANAVCIEHCVCDGNAIGMRTDYGGGLEMVLVKNCIFSNNSSYGIQMFTGTGLLTLDGNHFYANGTDLSGNVTPDPTFTSGDPKYLDRANHDFRIPRTSPAVRFASDGTLSGYAGAYVPFIGKVVLISSNTGGKS